jgi:hypothetical protein
MLFINYFQVLSLFNVVLEFSVVSTPCIPRYVSRYDMKTAMGKYVSGSVSQMTMYSRRIPCIPIQSSILRYCDVRVSLAETGSGCAVRQKKPFFLHGSVLETGRDCVTRQIL